MDIDRIAAVLASALLFACTSQEPLPTAQQPQKESAVIVRPKQELMTDEQRKELAFPARIISEIEQRAGAAAEPFYETFESSSENLRGEKGIERQRLAGFSVRTKNSDELITEYFRALRAKGYLIFRSRRNYGSVPDLVTVIRGGSSYDILKAQKTEAPGYRLDTRAIISWLRERQKEGSFFITGAGQDFVEARFTRQPPDMKAFARKVAAFAPDVLRESRQTPDKLAEQMKKGNGFRLVWD